MNEIEKAGTIVVKKLIKHGHIAFFAGGCVRDKLLGLSFKDIDITTSASPDEVIKLFTRTVPVGVQFGVVIVLINRLSFEVATFRKDGIYTDGRHPDSVEFTNEKEDVLRRDFTINGMLYNPLTEEVIDYVGGKQDLNNRIVRAIGDPYTRFHEDKLRMIRAIRFAARFSYQIDQQTWQAIQALHQEISQVSLERIRDELVKILTENNPRVGMELLDQSGLLEVILPEISQLKGIEQPDEFHPEGDVFEHTLLILENMKKPSKELALAALLHDIGKAKTFSRTDRIRFSGHDTVGAVMCKDLCERLKFSNKETDHIVELVEQHMRFMNVKKMRESKLKRFLRQNHFADHLELHRLDCIASHGFLDLYYFCQEKLNDYQSKEENLHPPKLINGATLIKLGLKPGPVFSNILLDIENAQLEGFIKTEEEALNYVQTHYQDMILNSKNHVLMKKND